MPEPSKTIFLTQKKIRLHPQDYILYLDVHVIRYGTNLKKTGIQLILKMPNSTQTVCCSFHISLQMHHQWKN